MNTLQVTFMLLRSLKQYRQEILREGGITGSEWNRIKKTSYVVPLSFLEDSRKQVYEAVEERVFQRALTLEFRAGLRLLAVDSNDAVSDYFRLLPNFHSAAGDAANDHTISVSPSCAFLFPAVEFSPLPRSGFPLSAHPLVRRLHPDFDAATGYDYDPYSMRKLEMRWNYTLFLQERVEALKVLKPLQ